MREHYILDGKTPIPCDLMTWARWLEKADRIVAVTYVDKVKVSTVFIGLDHDFSGRGPPQIFETMIFGGDHDQDQWRCSTWEQAEEQHRKAVALLSKSKKATLGEFLTGKWRQPK